MIICLTKILLLLWNIILHQVLYPVPRLFGVTRNYRISQNSSFCSLKTFPFKAQRNTKYDSRQNGFIISHGRDGVISSHTLRGISPDFIVVQLFIETNAKNFLLLQLRNIQCDHTFLYYIDMDLLVVEVMENNDGGGVEQSCVGSGEMYVYETYA